MLFMKLLKILQVPLIEAAFFREASHGVIRYFISKLVEFILQKVSPLRSNKCHFSTSA